MDDTIQTMRVEMTPEQARAFAAQLLAQANRVDRARVERNTPDAYAYVSTGASSRDRKGALQPSRIGIRIGTVED